MEPTCRTTDEEPKKQTSEQPIVEDWQEQAARIVELGICAALQHGHVLIRATNQVLHPPRKQQIQDGKPEQPVTREVRDKVLPLEVTGDECRIVVCSRIVPDEAVEPELK